MKHKFSSVSNDTSAKRSHRGVGQAVAALVMALALTIGGAGTTILLASQPAGLTVAPVTVDWEESSSLKHNNTKKHTSEPAASSTAEEPAAGRGRSCRARTARRFRLCPCRQRNDRRARCVQCSSRSSGPFRTGC